MRTIGTVSCAVLGFFIALAAAEAGTSSPDLNGDGVVNVYDASIVGSCYGSNVAQVPACAIADLDGDGQITRSDMNILASAFGNMTPTADAGVDQTVNVGDLVFLDGSGSTDPNGDLLFYSWRFISQPAGANAALSDPLSAQPTFVAGVDGVYVLELMVSDGVLVSIADRAIVTATQVANNPPIADAGPDQTGFVGDTVTLDASGSSDADGDTITFSWTLISVPPGSSAVLSQSDVVDPDFVIDLPGSYVAQLIVNDGLDDSLSDAVTISTINSGPVADAGPDQTAFVGDTVTLDGAASSDVDGDPLGFSWTLISAPAGSVASLSDSGIVNPSFEIDVAGSYVVQLIVNDGLTDSAPDTVTVSTENTAPVANAGPDQTGLMGESIVLDGSGSSDVDGDPLIFSWSLTPPAGSGASLSDPTSVKPTFVIDAAGVYVAQLIVNDGSVDSSPDTVSINTDNTAPVADAGPDQAVFVGESVTLDGNGSFDVDGDSLTFSWTLASTPLGSNATLSNGGTANPSFGIDLPGLYVAQLVVNDGLVDSVPDTISVSTENSIPVADAGPDQSVLVGDSVQLDGGGSSDADGDPLTHFWSLISAPQNSQAKLSDPLLVDPMFDVDLAGNYVAQLIVNDGLVDSAPDTVSISTDNSIPIADAGPDQSVDVGDSVTLNGAGSSDPDGDSLTYSWSLTAPAGSSAALSNSAAVSPTFVADVAGDYTVELIVNDGSLDSVPDSVDVTAAQAVQVSAQDDTALTPSDLAVVIDVLDNDLPSGGVGVVPASLTQPAHGSVTLNGDGTISYAQAGLSDQPAGLALYKSKCSSCHAVFAFNGTDTFTYAASDGSSSDSATVTVTVRTFDQVGLQGGDISWQSASCNYFLFNGHKTCAQLGGVTDPELSQISAFLATGFPFSAAAAPAMAVRTLALPTVADLRLAQLVVPARVTGRTAESRSAELRVSVCNDGPAVSGGGLSLNGVSSVPGVPDSDYSAVIGVLGNGSCSEATFDWDAPDHGTLVTWTATLQPTGGSQDPDPGNNVATGRTLVYPLR